MTRPTEKQLAEALEAMLRNFESQHGLLLQLGAPDFIALRDKAAKALDAYRSAQQAEAGAAGGVREQFDAWRASAEMGSEWLAFQAAFERGRQQGMEQAEREVVIHGDRWLITPLPAGNVEVRWLGEHLPDGKRLTPRPQPLRVEQAKPAASSAQKPGWVLVPVDPTPEMVRAAESAYKADAFGVRSAWPSDIYRSMLRAAPARLAGAAQGEAAEKWPTSQEVHDFVEDYEYEGDDGSYQPKELESVLIEDAIHGFLVRLYEGEFACGKPAHAHPQAQVERKPTLSQFTPRQRKRLWENSPEHHKDAASFAGFERIVSLTERAHCIPTASTASEGGEQ